eukprot:jgi/Psemu1/10653/gm1.10653_g
MPEMLWFDSPNGKHEAWPSVPVQQSIHKRPVCTSSRPTWPTRWSNSPPIVPAHTPTRLLSILTHPWLPITDFLDSPHLQASANRVVDTPSPRTTPTIRTSKWPVDTPPPTVFPDSPHLQASANRVVDTPLPRTTPTIRASNWPVDTPPVCTSSRSTRPTPTIRPNPHLQAASRYPASEDYSDHPHLQVASQHYSDNPLLQLATLPGPSYNMLTYTEYYQTTTSPLGVGPARDLAYQTIYDYFAEETATPILLGRLLDLYEPKAVGALGIFLTGTFGRARLRLVHGLRKYPGPLTAPSTNKGKAFGYLDDIEGDAGELVLVDAALLEQAPETLVLSLDRHLDVIKHAHHSHMIPMVLIIFLLNPVR